MSGLIAVTGASGEIGGRVAARLVTAGASLRLIARDSSRISPLPNASTAAAAYGDYAAMLESLADVETLFLVSASESLDRVDQQVTAVNAAVAAGVRRIIYLSFLAAKPDATFTFARDHWATEVHIRSTGVPATMLRPSLYLDLLPTWISDDGVIAGPAGSGRVAWVARDDVADAAAAVLLGESSVHQDAVYDLTGPESLSLEETATLLSAGLGRKVRYQEQTWDEAVESRQTSGAPQWAIEGWVSSYVAIANGELDIVSHEVSGLTGHLPMSVLEYLTARH